MEATATIGLQRAGEVKQKSQTLGLRPYAPPSVAEPTPPQPVEVKAGADPHIDERAAMSAMSNDALIEAVNAAARCVNIGHRIIAERRASGLL